MTAQPAHETLDKPNAQVADLVSALSDVKVLYGFAKRRGYAITEAVDTKFASVTAADPTQFTDLQKQELWSALGDLSALVKPASIAGIRATIEFEEDERTRPSFWRNRTHDSAARKANGRVRRWLFITLILVVVLQIYTLLGTMIIADLDRINGEFDRVVTQIGVLRAGNKDIDAANPPLSDLARKKDDYAVRIGTGYDLLRLWNVPWRGFSDTSDSPANNQVPEASPEDVAAERLADEQITKAILQSISLYILPLLYGLFGACTYIVRRISDEIERATFTPVTIYKYRTRLALGAALGSIASLLYSDDAQATLSLSRAGAAFLVGYNVEVAFAWLDVLVAGLRNHAKAKLDKLLGGAPPPTS